MAIEITGSAAPHNTPTSGEGNEVKVGRNEPNLSQQATGKPSTTDTVTLTDTAAQLNRLESALGNLPVVDPQRVEAIQQTIRSGDYRIDAERVAGKLMDFENLLSGSSQTKP